jgi:hypothetical protein
MARSHKEDVALSRQELLKRSALLRFSLVEQGKSLQSPLALADQACAGWQWLRAHPQWPLGGLLLFALKRPRRVLGWVPRLLWGWNLFKKARQSRAL